MPAFQPTADQFRAFRDDPYDGPIAQINLLKFKSRAEYPASYTSAEGFNTDVSGAEAYKRYVDAFKSAAAEVGGTCLLYSTAERYFIGNGDWDAALIMHFPSRQAFIATINHDQYETMHRHRDAGLLCQDLLTTRVDEANV